VHKLITHPTDRQPEFELTRKIWTTLNRIRTGHGRSGHMMFKWRLRDFEVCDYGHKSQMTSHIINECPLRAFAGTIHDIHQVRNEAIKWMEDLKITL